MAKNTMTTTTIAEGDFKSLKISDWDREMLEDAYQAVTKANRWGFLRRADVPGTKTCEHCKGNKQCHGRVRGTAEDGTEFRCWCVGECRVCEGKGGMKTGFMFSDAAELRDIDREMKYDGHSGASYGMTMRVMEFIAKNGWDGYVRSVQEEQRKKEEQKRKEERTYYRPVADVENHPIFLAQQAPYFPPTTPAQNLVTTAKVIDRAIDQALQQGAMDPLSFAQNLQANPEVRRVIPDIDDQAAAMKRFAEGKMSYAEMRSLCG